MINKKILAGILAASLATVPLITTYASMPDIEDVSYTSDDEAEEKTQVHFPLVSPNVFQDGLFLPPAH